MSIFCVLGISYGQHHDNLWMFGQNSDNGNNNSAEYNLNFSVHPPVFELEPKRVNFGFYSVSICDSIGELQFYSDGIRIWNSDHVVMENGGGINPGWFHDWAVNNNTGYPTAASGQCIPAPGKEDEYYMFHIAAEPDFDNGVTPFLYLYFTHIDMKANGGLGRVVDKNVVLRNGDMTYFGLTKHGNGRDWWLVISEMNVDIYALYLIDPEGIHLIDEYASGLSFQYPEGRGIGLFSPDGKYYVRNDPNGGPIVLDFDRCSGRFSNPRRVQYKSPLFLGGSGSISSNSRFLYTSSTETVLQIDLFSIDLKHDTIAEFDGFSIPFGPFTTGFGANQLGPDGKIYWATTNGTFAMHVVHRANLPGAACNFQQHGIRPPKINTGTIPHFPNYRLGPLEGSICDSLDLNKPRKIYKGPLKRPIPATSKRIVKKTVPDVFDFQLWYAIKQTGKIPEEKEAWFEELEAKLCETYGEELINGFVYHMEGGG